MSSQPLPSKSRKPPYNIVFVIADQRSYDLWAGPGYSLPAMDAIARQGVTFKNHYIASAMCTASRAALLTGRPPQVTGCIDQMQYDFSPTLDPGIPNMGSILKNLGYKTAYFGKFEMDKTILDAEPTVNYRTAIERYGFDEFSAGGDIGSAPLSGFQNDPFIAGESVRWLRENASQARRDGRPFFMFASFVNPHDIMFGNANLPGQPPAQVPCSPQITPPPPASSLYQNEWSFTLPRSLDESLEAPGVPPAVWEYKRGWDGWSGEIPSDRKDMWSAYYNYYLNTIRDEDRNLQQLVDVFDEMDLWQDTIFIFTSDHGEMGGAHGGLKGKGPLSYEANAHVPLLVAHPAGRRGASTQALTSHLDMLPTLASMTGLPESQWQPEVKTLPGRDFSTLLADPENSDVHKIRPGVLYNYVGVSTVDGDYLHDLVVSTVLRRPNPPLSEANLAKRGFLFFVFDGRYKFVRYYAPTAFNTPETLEELLEHNDVQLFDLENDPEELKNLALAPLENRDTMLRLNRLLNDLVATEIGVNDASFLPKEARAKTTTPQ